MAHFVKTEEEVELCEEGGDPEIHAAEGELVVWGFFLSFFLFFTFGGRSRWEGITSAVQGGQAMQ